jgi:phosphoglycolate phosphatase
MKKYKLFIFDCDGTLTHSKNLILYAVREAARALKVNNFNDDELRERLDKSTGMSLQEIAERLFPGVDYQRFHNEFHHHYSVDKLSNCFFTGAVETLQQLKARGVMLAMASNIACSKLKALLDAINIANLFDAVRCVDDRYGYRKPQAEMALTILEELAVEPAAAVMVGDSASDMQLARNAGIDAIAVDYGGSDIEMLQAYNPVAYIRNIRDILEFINL